MRADKMPGSVLPAEGDFSCAAVVVAGGASPPEPRAEGVLV